MSVALLLLALFLAVRWAEALRLEDRYYDAFIAQSTDLKDQGLALQRRGFARPDILTLYGSSELLRPVADRASLFFEHFPTNFAVNPIGKPGSSSIMFAEKAAALGPMLRGRKVAISLSPSFFLTRLVRDDVYAANFSPLLAGECLFNTHLSWDMRKRLAARMADFPETLEHRELLQVAARCLQSESALSRALFQVLQPAIRLQNALVLLQDHLGLAEYIHEHQRKLLVPAHEPQAVDWDRLAQVYDEQTEGFHPREKDLAFQHWQKSNRADHGFESAMAESGEWVDFELLLRVLEESGVQPLILSIPINGAFFDGMGITAAARNSYYDRLAAMCAAHGAVFADFRDHEQDAKFFLDTHDHLSAKGWLYYNEAIDEYFHGQPLSFVSR